MTYSQTRTATFTITDARYIASKLGADLRNLNARYRWPTLGEIPDYVEETAQYLKAGYLDYVDFGFVAPGYQDGDEWKLRLRYSAVAGGQLRDDVPGNLPSAYDIAGYSFYSFLRYNASFIALGADAKAAFQASLPIDRTPGTEPTANAGTSSSSSQYSRSGHGVDRTIYCAI